MISIVGKISALLLVALLLVGPTAFTQGEGVTETTEITGSLELDTNGDADAVPETRGGSIPWVVILIVGLVMVLLLSGMFVWRGRPPADMDGPRGY